MVEPFITKHNLDFKLPIPERYSTEQIIIRDSTGIDVKDDTSVESLHKLFRNKNYLGVGYHFIVRKDGLIEEGLPIYARGIHTNGYDWNSIGIHVSGFFDEKKPAPGQIESLSILVAYLTYKYGLVLNQDHVKGANELIEINSPGKNLDIQTIIGKAKWYIDEPTTTKPAIKDPMLSEHFSSSEFWCHGQDQLTCNCKHSLNIDYRLIELLEQLRSNIGGYPLYINSGYRCPVHNKAVGGVSNSQHILGKAADVEIPSPLTFSEFQWYVEQLPFDGIGLYHAGNFIHLDVRDGGIGSHIIFYGS